MPNNETIEVGAPVTVGALKNKYPQWSTLVKPGERKSGATGKVVGFYRLDYELMAVTHDDGSRGVYEVEELTSRR